MYPLILDQPATLHVRLDAWAHRRTYRIRLTEETRLNYRFQALEDIPVGTRWLRAEYKGRCMKPGLSEKAGLRLTLNALWLMTDDDPYPGEYALAVLTPLGSMMAQLGLSWIASGDVTPVQL